MIYVVVGAPCSGKSTHVTASKKRNDIVVDYDKLAEAIGNDDKHNAKGVVRSLAFMLREKLIDEVLLQAGVDAWIIHTSPNEKLIQRYIDSGCEFILMPTTQDECLSRADTDNRPDGTKGVIRNWFASPPQVKGLIMENKAYSVLQVKNFDDSRRVFTGVASTPTPDKTKDVLVSTGAKFSLPMPLLFHHDHTKPIGKVISANITDAGIEVEIELPEILEDGALKDRVEEAYQSLKYGLVNGLSVGFTSDWNTVEQIKDGGFKFTEWFWHELSLVVVPCNNDSYIQQIKAMSQDFENKAALGVTQKSATDGDSSVQKHVVVKLNSPNKGGIKL